MAGHAGLERRGPAETLRLQSPRTARFLRRSIPSADTTYTPRDADLRAEQHRPGPAGPDTWPVLLTRCGEDPGRWGDNTGGNLQRLQEAR